MKSPLKKIAQICCLLAVAVLVGWGTAEVIVNARAPKEKPPAYNSTRYVATPVSHNGKAYRLDHSMAISPSAHGTPYHAYYIYLGKVEWVPISSDTTIHYNGVTPMELTYSTSKTTQTSVTNSMNNTVSRTTETVNTNSTTLSAAVSAKLKTPFLEAAVQAGFSDTWASTVSAQSQISTTDTFTTFQSWAVQNTETIRFTIGNHGEASGYYRYALFATCDVYAVAFHDTQANAWAIDYSVFARSGTLFQGIDYSKTNDFGIGANAMSLRFDTQIVETLGTPENIYVPDTKQFQKIETHDIGEPTTGAYVGQVIQDDDNIYYGETGISAGSGRFVVYNKEDDTWEVPPGLNVAARALAQDNEYVYIGGNSGVVRAYNKETGAVTTIVSLSVHANDHVTALAQDNDNVYIGLGNGEFYVYSKLSLFTTTLIPNPPGTPTSGDAPSILSLAVDGNLVYVGRTRGLFDVYDKTAGTLTNRPVVGLTSGRIGGLVFDSQYIYLGVGSTTSAADGKLARISKITGRVEYFEITGIDGIGALAQCNNYVYIGGISAQSGTNGNSGMLILNKATGEMSTVNLGLGAGANGNIISMSYRLGTLAIGSSGGQLTTAEWIPLITPAP
jgi:hypothetical protein